MTPAERNRREYATLNPTAMTKDERIHSLRAENNELRRKLDALRREKRALRSSTLEETFARLGRSIARASLDAYRGMLRLRYAERQERARRRADLLLRRRRRPPGARRSRMSRVDPRMR